MTRTIETGRTLNQNVAAALGATYVLVGLVGFAVTGGVGFASTHGNHLLGLFEVNPFHNVVHLLVGGLLLAGSARPRRAVGVNALVGSVYLLVGVVGLFLTDSPANVLALNGFDNVLHFGSAIGLLAVASAERDRARVAPVRA